MTGHPILTCVILISTLPLLSQTPASPTTPTLTAGTQLVVLDVVVEDGNGHPIRGLKPSDFQVVESKSPQTIKTFDEHISTHQNPTKLPDNLHLTPGTFTDYLPFPQDATLNVLLLDTLNTPMNAQSYVRSQLQEYVKHANPGTRIAVFGLTSRLILLQGFTSDPDVLKTVVDHKLIPRASLLLDDATGSNNGPSSMADAMNAVGANAEALAGVHQFEAETASFQVNMRTQYTLAAFNQLARYLGSFPGRKNIIWFSGSFPLGIFPDLSLPDPFSVVTDASDELRQTTNLLDHARIAVYPIDARGLQTNPAFSASRGGGAPSPGSIAAFGQVNAQEHATMDQVAEDTGGRAFYNTNGIADAVSQSIEAGSNYYTLTYSPSNRNWNGEYRSIRVQLQGEHASRDLKLSYRHGYYADNPNTPNKPQGPSKTTAASAPESLPYSQAAMQRGAPTPSEILFKALVLPASNTPDDKVAPNNQPDPNGAMRGPFRLYNIDYAVLGSDFSLPLQPDGRHKGAVDFTTFVYSTDGKLINIASERLDMDLKPENYDRLIKSGLQFRLKISAPDRTESFLRIAVHDVAADRYGVIEVPTATISHLPPQPPATAPAAPK